MTARLLVVGISHHASPLDVRERLAIDDPSWRPFAPAELSTLLLSTCNRVEVYTWAEGRSRTTSARLGRSLAAASGVPLVRLRRHLVTRSGREAVLHLVRVASGLDSLVVGEDQIGGQVRQALRLADAARAVPAPLRGIFERALEAARHVRASTRLGQAPSVASAGVSVASRTVPGGLNGRLVLVLGAGVIARAAAEAALAHGARVRLLNRTPEHAQQLVRNMRGRLEVDALEAFPESVAEAALVVGATASREPVVTERLLRNRRPDLVVLDVAVPRDVDPRVRALPDVQLIDLDDLERLCPVDIATRRAEIVRAEELAASQAERIVEWLRFRAASPDISALRSYAESIRVAELRRSSRRLRDLSPEQLAAVDALTIGIVNKLMHGPTVALREAHGSGLGPRQSRARIFGLLRPETRRRTA